VTKERALLLSVVVLGCFVAAHSIAAEQKIQASTEEPAKPWTALVANDAPEDFSFVVVADRTGGHRSNVFKSAMTKVNLLEPAFVVSVGDLIEGYTDDRSRLDAEWREFKGLIDALDVPFFYAPGNHDMSNAVMSEAWRARFGPSFYHFTYKDVLFVVLNSELFGMVGDSGQSLPGPWRQSEQMDYIRGVLADYAGARWTFVLIHQPLWDSEAINPDWLEIEGMLGERNYTVFGGHHHRYLRSLRHDRKYITLATTGGSSPLRGPVYGEFDHVAMVSMTADGPTIANLSLDGILTDDVTTPGTRLALQKLKESVHADTEFFPGTQFTGGEIAYRISNTGSAPLTATPYVTGNEMLRLEGEVSSVRVAPGSHKQVLLRFTTPKPAMFEHLVPARVAWSLVSEIREQRIAMELQTAALPLRAFPVRRVPQAVVVDGDLAEWDLPYAVTRQGDIARPQVDPRDISYRFGVGYDEGHFYLAAAVVDDSIVASSARALLDQDGLVVSVDARPDPERSQNETLRAALNNGNAARMVMDVLTLDPPASDPLLNLLNTTRSRLQKRARRIDGGYAVELGVPAELLNEWYGSSWQVVRLDLHANDFDEGEVGSRTLHWQPYRFGKAPVVGTGTFVRQ
jgi:hypothetical protein